MQPTSRGPLAYKEAFRDSLYLLQSRSAEIFSLGCHKRGWCFALLWPMADSVAEADSMPAEERSPEPIDCSSLERREEDDIDAADSSSDHVIARLERLTDSLLLKVAEQAVEIDMQQERYAQDLDGRPPKSVADKRWFSAPTWIRCLIYVSLFVGVLCIQ